ncbi:MAG: glycosyltransferase [Paludibacteraceae bacterium]|nr:glycosyltransferase [Paludibacteraceae bacterium]
MQFSTLNSQLSIIIACRNEISNLTNLLESIKNQTFKPDEVIFVDDNSTDETYNFLINYSKKYNKIKVIKNSGKGKKSALIEAAKIATSKYLIFTDADCCLNNNHCELALQYLNKNNSDMLLGAVDIIDEKGIFNIIEKIEFSSLQAITAYTALLNNPIMCNGANLIIKRNIYIQYIDKINKNIASGDDMFMLHALKKSKAKINYLYDSNYIIKTKGTNSFKKFIIQRTRWASKSINYKDFTTILVAFSVAIINILLLIFIFLIPHFILPIFLIIFIIENIIMLPYLFKYKQHKILKYYPIFFPLMSLFYPLYILTIIISILFYKKNNPHWK